MTVFFIGAGCSSGTLDKSPSCPPVAAEFGRELARRALSWKTEYPALAQVAEHLHDTELSRLGLEQIWTCIDYYAKLAHALPIAAPWCNEVRDLKKALLRLYGQDCDRAADQLPLSDEYTLGELLSHQVKPGDLLISFNYDTLVERLASRFGCGLRSYDGKLRTDAVGFVKPHGSASWCLDLNYKRVDWAMPDGMPVLDSMAEHDVRDGREPLVLGAVPIKSELIREVQKVWEVEKVFGIVLSRWKAVVDGVLEADAFVLVGYSFPREDQYGRFLLQEGARRRRHDRPPLWVEYYEKPDFAAERAASILEVFQNDGIHLEWKGEVKPP